MKKVLPFLFATILCLTFCTGAFAVESSENIIIIGDVEVIFDSASTLSTTQKQAVAAYLVYGDSDVQTYNVLCTLFGHKNTTEYVTTISHCVQAEIPRCLEKLWEVNTCTRCDSSVESTVVNQQFINCCPVGA